MSKTLNRRKKLFLVYSKNLKKYIDYNKYIVFIFENGKGKIGTDNYYICPLCYNPFSEDKIENSNSHNFLTLEDNPPKSLGGKPTVLTCKECNNKNGAELDRLVGDLLKTESFFREHTHTNIIANIKIGDHKIKAELKKMGNNLVHVTPIESSNPWALRHLREDMQKRVFPKIEMKLNTPEWENYSRGMLKIAYLKAFELFGYYFADLGNGANIRDVLDKKAIYPCPNNGVIDVFADDNFLGVHIVVEPAELKSLIITQKLIIKNASQTIIKNIPVILPIPSEIGWKLLYNFHETLKKGKLNMSTQKIDVLISPLPEPTDYYSLFTLQY